MDARERRLAENEALFRDVNERIDVFPEVERVVGKHDGHWVVEKGGEAAELVEELDPRRPAAS